MSVNIVKHTLELLTQHPQSRMLVEVCVCLCVDNSPCRRTPLERAAKLRASLGYRPDGEKGNCFMAVEGKRGRERKRREEWGRGRKRRGEWGMCVHAYQCR